MAEKMWKNMSLDTHFSEPAKTVDPVSKRDIFAETDTALNGGT